MEHFLSVIYEKFVLDNGLEVYAINSGAQEVLQVELVFFAGNVYEAQNGVAVATNYMLRNGTSTKTAFQINEHFEYYGAYCNRTSNNETASVSLHTLSKHRSAELIRRPRLGDSIPPDSSETRRDGISASFAFMTVLLRHPIFRI